MRTHGKGERMDKLTLEDALDTLVKEFDPSEGLQQDKMATLPGRAENSQSTLQGTVHTTQQQRISELLAYLRTCIKYQAFDLEATRRENAYLHRLLDDSRL